MRNSNCLLSIGKYLKDALYIMTKWPGGIAIFTAGTFEAFTSRIHELQAERGSGTRILACYFESSAVELERDSEECILIPPYLQTFAGVDDQTEISLCQIKDDEYGELYFLTAAGNHEEVFEAYRRIRIPGHFLEKNVLWKGRLF